MSGKRKKLLPYGGISKKLLASYTLFMQKFTAMVLVSSLLFSACSSVEPQVGSANTTQNTTQQAKGNLQALAVKGKKTARDAVDVPTIEAIDTVATLDSKHPSVVFAVNSETEVTAQLNGKDLPACFAEDDGDGLDDTDFGDIDDFEDNIDDDLNNDGDASDDELRKRHAAAKAAKAKTTKDGHELPEFELPAPTVVPCVDVDSVMGAEETEEWRKHRAAAKATKTTKGADEIDDIDIEEGAGYLRLATVYVPAKKGEHSVRIQAGDEEETFTITVVDKRDDDFGDDDFGDEFGDETGGDDSDFGDEFEDDLEVVRKGK